MFLKMRSINLFMFLALLAATSISCKAASFIVASSNSTPEAKRRADLICDGKEDQFELLKSITKASQRSTVYERNPATLVPTKCYSGHSVEWLPGDYYLSETLVIPDAEDCAILAEGTRFHYQPKTGDAVVLTGMSRCRYRLGTIFTDTNGAALRVKPTENMPSLMSIVSFTGLIGTDQKGIGLCVDSTVENVCTMRFEGTDIRGFDIGVFVPDARPSSPEKPGSGKTDTNWYWFSYIRLCKTCIWEQNRGVDDGIWYVNIDASAPDSIAARIGGVYGKWMIILGTYDWHTRPGADKKTRSIIIDPGAHHNVIEVTPPLEGFAPWEDKSGNSTNIISTATSPRMTPPTK